MTDVICRNELFLPFSYTKLTDLYLFSPVFSLFDPFWPFFALDPWSVILDPSSSHYVTVITAVIFNVMAPPTSPTCCFHWYSTPFLLPLPCPFCPFPHTSITSTSHLQNHRRNENTFNFLPYFCPISHSFLYPFCLYLCYTFFSLPT